MINRQKQKKKLKKNLRQNNLKNQEYQIVVNLCFNPKCLINLKQTYKMIKLKLKNKNKNNIQMKEILQENVKVIGC